MASQSSVALVLSLSTPKFSISRGLMRKLSDIFFSSSSCSFVLFLSIWADDKLNCEKYIKLFSVTTASHTEDLRPHVNVSQDVRFACGENLLMANPPLRLKMDNSDKSFDYIYDPPNTCYMLCFCNALLLDLSTVIMFGEEYTLLSFRLCHFLQSLNTCFLCFKCFDVFNERV